MRFWWVFQNKTWREEQGGGYLWAPKRNSKGQSFFYWNNVAQVEPGDLVFACYDQRIKAVGVARSGGHSRPSPREIEKHELWGKEGWGVDVDWEPLSTPIPITSVFDDLRKLMRGKYSPLGAKGGNQGYLFALSEDAAQYILATAGWEEALGSADGTAHDPGSGIEGTYRESVGRVRVGQAHFRKLQRDYWKDSCAVTGSPAIELLRASHTVPWSICSPSDRTNVFNGFLLSPAYDAVFDAHLASFDDEGKIVLSEKLKSVGSEALGVSPDAQLRHIEDGHREFLAKHRARLISGS